MLKRGPSPLATSSTSLNASWPDWKTASSEAEIARMAAPDCGAPMRGPGSDCAKIAQGKAAVSRHTTRRAVLIILLRFLGCFLRLLFLPGRGAEGVEPRPESAVGETIIFAEVDRPGLGRHDHRPAAELRP